VKLLSDHLREGLDLVFIGINPGMKSAAAGHHYAGPGNHFWPLLHESGLVSEALTSSQDDRVLEWNIGLTNMVDRPSPGIADLSTDELRAGAAKLRRKLLKYQPRIACFNGKRIFEVFAGRRCELGLQPERVGRTLLYVMPSTSARGAAYQRADKLPFFVKLRKVVATSPVKTVAS
jgi:thymine-DNA glycosylase